MSQIKEPEKKPVKLNISRFSLVAEFKRKISQCIPEAGTTLEQMLDPSYWAHVAAKLAPMDRIEVNAEDGSFYAELLVMSASKIGANVKPLHFINLGAPVDMETPDIGMMVKYAGIHAKWRVLRTSDGAKVRDGFATREEAVLWMNDQAKALAA